MYRFNKDTLEYEKVNFVKYFFISLVIFVSLGFGVSEVKTILINGEKEIKLTENLFSEKDLKLEISKYNFKFPEIIYAQAILETGNFKSKVFIENNNLFGMKQAGRRVTTALGTENSHAFYKNWKESVSDRALFESAYLRNLSREEYMRYLKLNYAEIKDYDILIENIINKKLSKKRKKNVTV